MQKELLGKKYGGFLVFLIGIAIQAIISQSYAICLILSPFVIFFTNPATIPIWDCFFKTEYKNYLNKHLILVLAGLFIELAIWNQVKHELFRSAVDVNENTAQFSILPILIILLIFQYSIAYYLRKRGVSCNKLTLALLPIAVLIYLPLYFVAFAAILFALG